ncbi:1-acyl-sn-glycerol-3-phosphate acyltransferase [Acinetobacter sp. ANC 4648]|uniref:1-acyl-sn-glycerol-3-phosphate acyltransferase n=1 Tax=Acinetobacter sp. ANC 4648 TaxID=1977875 RepID=UPI000A35886C|nr:1-acyl-sn-glycerol-3-phosphate acyltransferase [Acinetobacter sp. ANC 4648]OTG83749.1 acyltransferase [Acinetobacter sp. ANC 4648]
MTSNFPILPEQVPQRGSLVSRYFFRNLYLAQGWGFEGEFPNIPKAVAIISPHTSYFDGFYAFLAMLGVGIQVTILGKDSLFKTPLKSFFKWIGVIPVQRDSPHGLTQQVIDIIHARNKIWIALAPEGTRKSAEKIKSGFYHIAYGAHIPIVMFAFDYDHKIIRCLGVIYPTGNYEKDLGEILSHYEGQFSPKISARLAKPLQKLFKKR